jgi:rhomboid protease GluP
MPGLSSFGRKTRLPENMENWTPESQQQPEYEQEQIQRAGNALTFGQLLAQSTPRYFVAPALMGLNVAAFLLMALFGASPLDPTGEQLLAWGANFGPLTLGGEWWRLLSATFIHIGIIHLALNMQCLWRLGNLAERLFGNWAFLMLYILSGLGGSVASLWWNPNTIGAGASGAIFGVAGGLLAFLYFAKLAVPRTTIQSTLASTLVFVGYNLLYGFTSTGIDNAAHIGGLVTGALVGALFTRPLPPPMGHSRAWRYLAATGLVLLLVVGTLFLREQEGPIADLMKAEKLLQAGEFDQAIEHLEKALEADPGSAVGHYYLGIAYAEKGIYEDAIAAYTQAISLDPQFAEAHLNRGIAYALTGQYEKAFADLSKGVEIDDGNAYAYFVRGSLYAEAGERENAISDLERALQLGLEPEDAQHAERLLQDLRE